MDLAGSRTCALCPVYDVVWLCLSPAFDFYAKLAAFSRWGHGLISCPAVFKGSEQLGNHSVKLVLPLMEEDRCSTVLSSDIFSGRCQLSISPFCGDQSASDKTIVKLARATYLQRK